MAKTPEPQTTFPFLKLAKEAAADIPTKGGARSTDRVTNAKTSMLAMLMKQIGYVDDKEANRPLPKSRAGDRDVATWFSQTDTRGYWTNIRWGQRSLKLGDHRAWFFDTAEELKAFYVELEKALNAGQLDTVLKERMAPPAPVLALAGPQQGQAAE